MAAPWLFDAHLDLAWNALDWRRDLLMPLAELRRREAEEGLPGPGRGRSTVTLPELRRAGARVVVATVLARVGRQAGQELGGPQPVYPTAEACAAAGFGQLEYYRCLERRGVVRVIETAAALQEHLEELPLWRHAPRGPVGVILSIEGADVVLDPDHLTEWHRRGVRAVGLTHYGRNRYGGGTGCEDGLAPEAFALLDRIAELGMALDLTHLTDRGHDEAVEYFQGAVEHYNEAVRRFTGNVLASHQNCRARCPGQRQFTDRQIKNVAERDGVLGVALDAWMLQPGLVRGQAMVTATLETVAEHVDHICQVTGRHRHVGIGSDLDGGFGTEQTPRDVDSVADLGRLAEVLSARGFSDEAVAAVFHGNFVRFFSGVLPG